MLNLNDCVLLVQEVKILLMQKNVNRISLYFMPWNQLEMHFLFSSHKY